MINIDILKPRAENYMPHEIDMLAPEMRHKKIDLFNIFDEAEKANLKALLEIYKRQDAMLVHPHILTVIGCRGTGKTFTIRARLMNLIREGSDAKMYIFKKNNRLEELDKYTLASKEDWKMPREGREIVIYDDIHYLCESVLRQETNVETLNRIFASIIEDFNNHKNVTLISDSTLGMYGELIKDDEFNEIILKYFGDFSHEYIADKIQKKGRENIEYSKEFRNIQLDSIGQKYFYGVENSHNSILDIIKSVGVEIDSNVLDFFYKMHVNPRGIVNCLRLLNERNLTYENLIKRTINIVENSDLKPKIKAEYVCVLKHTEDISSWYKKMKLNRIDIDKVKNIFGTYKEFEDYIYLWALNYVNIKKEFLRDYDNYIRYNSYRSMDKVIKLRKSFEKNDINILVDYRSLLKKLKKNNEPYHGDDKVFIGWKGNYNKMYKSIKRLSKEEIDLLWKKQKIPDLYNIFLLVFKSQIYENNYVRDMLDHIKIMEKRDSK